MKEIDKKQRFTQSLGEEISNAVSHCVAALLAIAGTPVIIVRACMYSGALGIVSAALYGASLILLYTFSTLYHSLTNYKAKSVFQTFDHCSIFILICGTYAPVSLTMIGGWLGWALFGLNVFCTVLGVTLNAINVQKFHKLSMVLYILMGWSVAMIAKPFMEIVPQSGLWLLLAGGLAYTGGIVFYKLRKKYMHFIWHLFVLAGSVLQYFFVLFYCFPKN